MRKLVLLAAIALSFTAISKAQSNSATRPEKCGFVSHLEWMKALNPDLEKQMREQEAALQQAISSQAQNRTNSPSTIYTIPCVVHVVYKTTGQNISDAQIQSQIDVLNEDFARLNADTVNTPAPFAAIAGHSQFQFCLAKTDPNGNLTNGIERRQTTTTSFSTNDNMKHYSSGGMDAWNTDLYFNIWVCNMSGGILGYAEFPSATHTNTYGVSIQYNSFGRTGNVASPYNLGRTATHEIGHCFNLYHIWGDDGGACTGSDNVTDTPNQSDMTYGCLNFPATDACNTTANGIMFMNYMDYSDDNCLNLFTQNQVTRMNSAASLMYNSLLHSTMCELPTAVNDLPDMSFSVYPNPTDGIFNIDLYTLSSNLDNLKVRVTDMIGNVVSEKVVNRVAGQVEELDLSSQANGVYFVTLYNSTASKTVKVTLAK